MLYVHITIHYMYMYYINICTYNIVIHVHVSTYKDRISHAYTQASGHKKIPYHAGCVVREAI